MDCKIKGRLLHFCIVFILILSMLTGCTQALNTTVINANASQLPSANLKVHFIDVGQADSMLIQQGSSAMLIDAGNNDDGNTVVNYIKSQKISNLNNVIGTHPHEDHIGGLDTVINSLKIEKIYMPKVSNTTKTFTDVLTAIKNKALKVTTPVPGSTFKVGDATVTILAPNGSSYEDLNNNSIVIKLTYGKTSFLLAGDAEEVSENEMLNKGFNLTADVLKVGHHGSSSSTSEAFLNKVNPKYAVIMLGKDNTYGHPHKETMDKLNNKNIKIYRTDINGTVIAASDGKTITFSTKQGTYSPTGATNSSSQSGSTITKPNTTASSKSKIVYYTPSGKSYHYDKKCRTLARSKTILQGTLQQAINLKHADPCDVCVH
jgi:competence protein ComEC